MREEQQSDSNYEQACQEGRVDEYQAYANNNQGYLQTREQVLRIDRGQRE